MICLDDLIRDPRNVCFAFVCHVMLHNCLHTSAQLIVYGMMNSVRGELLL